MHWLKSVIVSADHQHQEDHMDVKEYHPGEPFPGIIGRTPEQSEPAWPALRRAREGAPNVLFIVLDDMGYGQLGCYGSPIRTPNMDRLAEQGLRYSNYHTPALCSPTRSCLLTGRNHHSNGVAAVIDMSTGFPGSNGIIPFENGFLSEILRMHGYNTYALGKWHLTSFEQCSAAGPYDRWPLGRGFERYYGFLRGDTHQYYPDLVHDNHQVDPPRTPEQGYHLTEDMADRAIQFVDEARQAAPDKPFFLYFATGAMHAPHHVPKQWADRYRGQFDEGWGIYRETTFQRQKELGLFPADAQLSRHDPDVQDWNALSPEERRLYARMMEVYAGFLEHTDHHIGRVLDHLQERGELDNTLVMLVSDNGASAEGGVSGSTNENKFFNNVPDSLEENLKVMDELGSPKHFNHYPRGWAFAGDTPFRRWKRETYQGGTSDPLIVHWPAGFKSRGEVRHQYVHAIDLMPTVLDALDIQPPQKLHGVTQAPIEGLSFTNSFDAEGAESRRRTQYFETLGHRSIYHNGWKAVCPVPAPSYSEAPPEGLTITEETLRRLDAESWELYHVAEDPTETRNLAESHRDKLIEMIAIWYVEAGKYQVLPLDNRVVERMTAERPTHAAPTEHYVYYQGTGQVPSEVAVNVLNRPHRITARVAIPSGGAEGVLLSHGGNTGGYSLYIKDRKLHYVHNYVGAQEIHLESTEPVPEGTVKLSYDFQPSAEPDIAQGKGSPGTGKLYIADKLVAEREIPVTVPLSFSLSEGLSCGRDSGAPVTEDYRPPFAFSGLIDELEVEVGGWMREDVAARTRQVLARE
ncbi:arylsulfatase [Gilvimarinus sp. F26214L]|uniref:arylsulfatase n=1 Tax=Gilvimarinus sp. DZF01 TaxID=3461371 RepID=UPI004045E7EF